MTQNQNQSTAMTRPVGNAGGMKKLLIALAPRIAAILPAHIRPETMVKIIGSEVSRNPKLLECTQESLVSAFMQCSQYGLEVAGPFAQAHLIPRWNKDIGEYECHFQPGYRGPVALAHRTGQIKRINAQVAYQSEVDSGDFIFTREPPMIRHSGAGGWSGQGDSVAFAYCVVETKGGSVYQEVLDRGAIDERRRMAESDKVWGRFYPAMARKSAINALFFGGLIPMSTELVGMPGFAGAARAATAIAGPADALGVLSEPGAADPLASMLDAIDAELSALPGPVDDAPEISQPPPAAPMAESFDDGGEPAGAAAAAAAAADVDPQHTDTTEPVAPAAETAEERAAVVEKMTGEVIFEINRLAGSRFKAASKQNRDLVTTLLDQGFSLTQMLDVAAWAFDEWTQGDEKSRGAFVPPTVLRLGPFRESLAGMSAAADEQVVEPTTAGRDEPEPGADEPEPDGSPPPPDGDDREPWMKVQDEISLLGGATEEQAQAIAIDLKLPGDWIEWTAGQADAVVNELRTLNAEEPEPVDEPELGGE